MLEKAEPEIDALTAAYTAPPLPRTLEVTRNVDPLTVATDLAQIEPPSPSDDTFEKTDESTSAVPSEAMAAPAAGQ